MPVNNFKTGTAKYRLQTYKNSLHMSIKIYSIALTIPWTLLNIFVFLSGNTLLHLFKRTYLSSTDNLQTADVSSHGRWRLNHTQRFQLSSLDTGVITGCFSWDLFGCRKTPSQFHTLRSPPSHPMDLAMMSSDRKIVSCKRLCF